MNEAPRATYVALCKWLAAGMLIMTNLSASAQIVGDLPAQSLAATLLQLQREAGVNIIAPSEVLAGRNAPAVSGRVTVKEALARVLERNGLVAEQVSENTFVIRELGARLSKDIRQ